MGSFLNRLSAVGRSDGHQNVTHATFAEINCGKTKKCQTRTAFFLHEPSRVGSWAHDRAFCTSFGMHAACGRELAGLPNDIEGAVPIINAASAVLPSFMGIVPEEGSRDGKYNNTYYT